MQRKLVACALAVLASLQSPRSSRAVVPTANPILFVTQVPTGDFTSVAATFGNHVPSLDQAPRGGDLVIRYGDGTLRYLTQEAGYGSAGMQGANAIAVREPCVHWSGQKAIFSMVVGAPTQRYQVNSYRWQIHEVSGLGQGETVSIRRIPGQPTGFNNVSPIYATDGRILFTSDRPPTGAVHLYPQRDEYESAPTVAGIYALDEGTGTVTLLEHAPSGAFSLFLDSFGRVVFTKWDHLQRDQQGDAAATAADYGAFTYASESASAGTTTSLAGAEVFPEPRTPSDPAYSAALSAHRFNHFFPWEINQDGTGEETLNHVGRHELGGSYTDGSFSTDSNLTYFVSPNLHANQLYLRGDGGLFHLREDPTRPGDFLATSAPEFGTASGGTLMRLTGAPSVNADDMVLTAVTPTDASAQVPQQTGYFRNPLPLTDGTIVAAHTAATGSLANLGTTAAPNWSYAYRLKLLTRGQNGSFSPTATLTGGIVKNLSWWTPDLLASYHGPLWELDPVEVVSRSVSVPRTSVLPSVEAQVFGQAGVNVEAFKSFLRTSRLALIVSRNVTQRDRADRHQPFNLRIPNGVSSVATGGQVYDVEYLQIFQGDALRGYGGPSQPSAGRRLLPRPMHEPGVSQAQDAPPGAVRLGSDGSMAALVPAQRALTWQLTDPDGAGVVRERNWLSFQAGEIRVCGSCHAVNKYSQTGASEPTNPPQALLDLLVQWKQLNPGPFPTPTATPTLAPTPIATGTPTAGGPPAVTPIADAAACAGTTIEQARLRAWAGGGRLLVRGEATLPKPWVRFAPATHGVRLVVAGVMDVFVPGGSLWATSTAGTRWSFRAPSGQAGGVRRIQVVDRSAATDGKIQFSFLIDGVVDLPSAAPNDITVGFGTATECATAHFGAPEEPRPHCASLGASLVCR